MRRYLACCLCLFACGASNLAPAAPTTGLINMPDARFNADGTLQFGLSYAKPYLNFSAAATLLPWLETNLGVTQIQDVPGFPTGQSGFGSGYGAYKDKTSGLKVRLLSEGAWRPAIALGVQDPIGTSLFERSYVAATKSLGETQLTLGYGRQQIDGMFGGVRYVPSWLANWSFVAEYDASDYKSFPFADGIGVADRTKGISYGVEYRLGWMSAAVSNQRGTLGVGTYLAIPLDRAEWVPKFAEPEPYTKVLPRPTLAQWEEDPVYRKRLYAALFQQSYKDVRLRLEPNARLTLVLTNSRISEMSRAVGRAARTVLALAPLETTEIHITYTTNGLPVATYEFSDLRKLNRYFNGLLGRRELAETVIIRYADPASYSEKEKTDLLAALDVPADAKVLYGNDGNFISFKSQDAGLSQLQIKPTLSTYLNGPNVFQYSLGVLGTYDWELAERLFLNTGVLWTLYQNISDAVGGNTSTLPHVRSDFSHYYGGYSVKLDHMLLNRVYQPSERTYARLSGGYIEQMYGGFEGQWLYVARGTPWAFDFSVDAVRKRDYDGGFGFFDYQTATALAAVHYKLPYQSTFTMRAGRFLAGDVGARFEVKRRYRIGMELGAWYTLTNALDTGIPSEKNYHDKGVFVSIPFESLLPNDTKVTTGFSIAPWTRDVGQMVKTPVDLYDMIEKPMMIDLHKSDGLSRFGDMADEYNLPYLGSPMWDEPFENFGRLTVRDWADAPGAVSQPGVWETVLLGAGAIAAAGLFDASIARAVDRHPDSQTLHGLDALGKWLPVVAMGGAGLAALSEQDKRLSNTGIAALEAGATGLLVNAGLKYAVGRARPEDGLGTTDFDPFQRPNASFPSNHTTVMWATITPFAKEYDAPWLYGVAALVNAGRIASREHWLSDTVASSLLGYAMGDFFWQERRSSGKGPKVLIGPQSVTLKWETN
ncbi:MAG TPA: YjbH domain-containing protein [Burkholderiales bacterium]|nr:YjbH domain-containing protein [Burkholderiales bacterium]